MVWAECPDIKVKGWVWDDMTRQSSGLNNLLLKPVLTKPAHINYNFFYVFLPFNALSMTIKEQQNFFWDFC